MKHQHHIHTRGLLVAFVFLLFNLSEGQTLPYMTSNVEEISGLSFDYIVVGGGASGCPLAATLSQKFSVLLIERGGSPYDNPLIMNKTYFGYPLLQTDEFFSVAQSFYSKNNNVTNYRGRVLGGTSAINAGFYSRASDDFVVNRTAWDKDLVNEAYEWVESNIVFEPLLTEWQETVGSRLLEAGLVPYNGYNLSHLVGTKSGGSIFDKSGKRHPPSDLLGTENPDNIKVLLNATVSSIIFETTDEIIARGVKFIESGGSPSITYEVYLNEPGTGDVILSAGPLGSPQILLLSGIGPKSQLEKLNIPLVLDLELVGQNLQDNPAIFIPYEPEPGTHLLPDPVQVVGVAEEFEFLVQGVIFPTNKSNETNTLFPGKVAFPDSEGMLELNSTDPRKNPSVDFNYLATEHDLGKCVKLVPLVEKVAHPGFIDSSSPDELREFCKENVQSNFHYHGGCTVRSVVDDNYRVFGVKSLRVVDFSTFWESPGTNPMATLLMLGRYQGIKILNETQAAGLVFSS